MARKTLDRARAAGTLIACAPRVVSPKTCDLIESTFPASSHDRAELLSRLIALGLLQYAQHMASYRAWRHRARAWGEIARGDAKGTFWAIARAFGTFALVAEPLRLSRRTYRALLRRELATRFGGDVVNAMLTDEALASAKDEPIESAREAAASAAVGAPAFARAALDAAADGIEACVAMVYHAQCLFQSSFWSAPVLIGSALIGQVAQNARTFDGYEAKKEAHRAETATARLRELLAHARTDGEAIALANGAITEAEEAMATLEAGQEFVYRREVLNARASFPSDVYDAAANLLPVATVLPRLVRGVSVNAWDIQVAMSSFNGIRAALAVLVQNMSTLRTAELHAGHVSNLYDALDVSTVRGLAGDNESGGASVRVDTPEDDMSLVEVDSLSLRGYDGQEIIRGLDFVLCRGDSLAVVGPAGCGKTMLVKALVGLWSYGSGSARVIHRSRVCVLSRKPYFPKGSLLDVCLYPTSSADIGTDTRELLTDAMVALGLGRHIDYLDAIAPWGDNLSPSEQQRFAVCRAVVNRVDLCVLDDATCAMDPKDRAASYDVLKKHVSGILSLGDEVSLPKHHSRTLRVRSDGTLGDFEEMASPVTSSRINVRDVAREAIGEPLVDVASEESDSSASGFNPLQMEANRRENQFIRRQKKNVARALGVNPQKFGVVPTPTKSTKGKPLAFDPLA